MQGFQQRKCLAEILALQGQPRGIHRLRRLHGRRQLGGHGRSLLPQVQRQLQLPRLLIHCHQLLPRGIHFTTRQRGPSLLKRLCQPLQCRQSLFGRLQTSCKKVRAAGRS